MAPEIGIVSNQAQAIRSTTVHLRAPSFWRHPTPMIDAEMLWVVESGIPKYDAKRSRPPKSFRPPKP